MLERRHLVDVPELLPVLVQLFEQEWESHYGASGPGDAESDLRAAMNRERLPICLVGIDQSGELVGTISLKPTSFSHRHLTPWAGGLLVRPSRRRQGAGTQLVGFAEDEARRLGYRALYTATDAGAAIVENRGWRAFDTTESDRGPIHVYSIDLR